jgi:hypothetical protein
MIAPQFFAILCFPPVFVGVSAVDEAIDFNGIFRGNINWRIVNNWEIRRRKECALLLNEGMVFYW